ncbi:FHA domain-containing protein [Bifidobacterium sp.]|uniref:variant leucine-rich repeat-containing protein n=1 Tax=Bifidobacterium sp. TaxID=41200 RepID=UPI0025BEEC82|nr:FHA domain-containing protein [Bifidobacterium sp.]MCH4209042.1 FHA domain-containing protein [Bifidobacterium sp.]MCI1225587.1 FHA domain-containing protein [Bifidobacterium sp.]
MSEQRWIVKGNGTQQLEVSPGHSVEIGRKPLRPLPDDGFERMEIEDKSRSMSKRHVVLSVSENGSAVLRDLNSTNGTYVVRADGALMRVEGGVDFLLPTSPVRMQFGDVPVDFIRVEEPPERGEETKPKVADLFAYAASQAKPKPDVAAMSVDDILNLRAGEPTTALPTSTVAAKVNELKASAARSFLPAHEAADAVESADASEEAGEDASEDAEKENPAAEHEHDSADIPGAAPQDDANGVSNAESGNSSNESDVSRGDAFENGAGRMMHAGSGVVRDGNETGEGQPADDMRNDANGGPEDVRQPSPADAGQDDFPMAGHVVERMSVNIMRPGQQAAAPRDLFVDALAQPTDNAPADAAGDGNGRDEGDSPRDSADAAIEVHDVFGTRTPQRGARPMDGEAHADETAVFKPAFEPGSVFERVSRGDFGKREPAVEVDGMTSDEAKRTADFTRQFEMARRPQLLPFLAMNPSLYDDLYAWLSALGDKDIDAALSRNSGYEEYRTAVGK